MENNILIKRIYNKKIVDIFDTPTAVLFCVKNKKKDGLKFFSFNVASQLLEETDEHIYFMNKYGENYEYILSQLNDVYSPSASILDNGVVYVVYPTGEIGHFDENGELLSFGFVYYDDAPIRDCILFDDNLFCVVPGRNCIVRFNTELNKIDMRIGGDLETSFNMPISLFLSADEEIFVNNYATSEITVIDAKSFTHKGKIRLSERADKFYKILRKQIVVMSSGIYLMI